MAMNLNLMSGAMRELSASHGAVGSVDSSQLMRDLAEESMAFHAVLTDMVKAQNNFHMVVSAKQEGMKSIAEITREGIRKSAER